MKNLLTFVCLFLAAGWSTAQTSNAVIFSETGLPFNLLINGVSQSPQPQSNIKVTGLTPGIGYKGIVVFQDNSIPNVTVNLYLDPNVEVRINVKRNKKGKYIAQYMGAVAINQNTEPNQYVTNYGSGTGTGGNTTTTTTTTVQETTTNPNNTVVTTTNTNPGGLNTNVQVTETGTTTTSTTGTTSTNVNTNVDANIGINTNVSVTETQTGGGNTENVNVNMNVGGFNVNISATGTLNGGGDGGWTEGTTNTNTNANTNVNVNTNTNTNGGGWTEGGNTNVNVNTNGGWTEGTTTTTTTTTTHTTTTTDGSSNANWNNNTNNTNTNTNWNSNNQGGYVGQGCAPIQDADLVYLKAAIKNESFSDGQLKQAKQISQTKCLRAIQVKEIMDAITFEDTKIEYAIFAYQYCSDPQNYVIVKEGLTFSSSKDKLGKALNL